MIGNLFRILFHLLYVPKFGILLITVCPSPTVVYWLEDLAGTNSMPSIISTTVVCKHLLVFFNVKKMLFYWSMYRFVIRFSFLTWIARLKSRSFAEFGSRRMSFHKLVLVGKVFEIYSVHVWNVQNSSAQIFLLGQICFISLRCTHTHSILCVIVLCEYSRL